MKRILISILGLVGLLTAPAAFAQSSTHSPYQQPQYFAIDYGQWAIQGQSANTYLFSPGGLCNGSASGTQFFPFSTNGPVEIVDATPANSEVVTPSSVTNTGSQCGFSASPSNNHYSFQVKSGTAGLQESLNALAVKSSAYPALIILDRNWFATSNNIPGTTSAAIIAAAAGNTHALLEDLTTAGPTFYVYKAGTGYISGTWSNAKPTAAAGAGAGTSPTISDAGTALAGTVSLTSGTSTTTGALFTLTWASSGQFLVAPTACTVTSIGTNSYTTFTSATSYSSGGILTVTVATTPPVASTAYKFSYSCY